VFFFSCFQQDSSCHCWWLGFSFHKLFWLVLRCNCQFFAAFLAKWQYDKRLSLLSIQFVVIVTVLLRYFLVMFLPVTHCNNIERYTVHRGLRQLGCCLYSVVQVLVVVMEVVTANICFQKQLAVQFLT
jgi:hypothetical protein